MPNRALRLLLVAAAFALATVWTPNRALASPPANDNVADAQVISLPQFTDTGNLDGTTTESGEPQFCNFQAQTVWYSFTAASTAVLTADLNGSDFGVVLNVYRSFGGGFDGFGFMGCIGPGGSMQFTATPGATYYIQVGSVSQGAAHMQLNVQQLPPPVNDDFADAMTIGAVPFAHSVDLAAATTEPGERINPTGAFTTIEASAWYVFTATGTEPLSVNANACCVTPIITVYTGSALDSLTEVASRSGQAMAFRPVAGTTYYVQLGRAGFFGGNAQVFLRVELAPPPMPNFSFHPFDPSTFDAVQFFDGSFDPAGVGIQSVTWDFGDGTTETGCCFSHRYAADADYTVNHTVTTFDGRTAADSRVVQVRTHDVAIIELNLPTAGRAGRTYPITVGVSNGRYPETVEVRLSKSAPGGSFQVVGTLTQFTPVFLRKNRTVPFEFSYTFTPEDAQFGKVTFQAVATIVGARDAHPADNTLNAAPIAVRPVGP